MSDVTDSIVLGILAVAGLRNLLAYSSLVPRQGRFGRWIYGNAYHEQFLGSALADLGIAKNIVRKAIKSGITPGEGKAEPLPRLIRLVKAHLITFDDEVTYGKLTPIRTKYYINTMEAAHSASTAAEMAVLLEYLISSYEESKPDFVLGMKAGNPLLIHHYATLANVRWLSRKPQEDKSRALVGNDPERQLGVNYEGGTDFLAFCRTAGSTTPLRGIAADCNASGCSALLEAITEFNQLVQQVGLPVTPIASAYLLFRPDNDVDVDRSASEKGITVRRFLDFSEGTKAILAGLDMGGLGTKKERRVVRAFVEELRKEGLIKWKGAEK